MRDDGAVISQDYLDAVWDAVPEGAEPELFAERRALLLEHVRPGQTVADVGCGEGAFSAAVAQARASPIAIDVADEPLRRLRARFPQLTDVRRAEAGRALPVGDREADVAWAGEVVEHVVDTGAFATDLRRIVKPGGTLVLTTPDHPRRLLVKLALRPGAFDEHVWPYADHLRFFTRRTLRMVLEDAGFGDVTITSAHGHLHAVAR
jgi:2-polyprenyl-3-methyl-5-hydroxy-6-metoxy-1,4-benzoquinol methylase